MSFYRMIEFGAIGKGACESMPAYLKSRVFENQTIEGTELVLTDSDNNYLGPDLVLEKCRLVLKAKAKCLHIPKNVQFVDCEIEVKKKLVNFQDWCSACISGCKFTGYLKGNDFGHWPECVVYVENGALKHRHGSIANCDLSGAVLDGCRFVDCDLGSLKLPRWPCFMIPNPHEQRSKIESVNWPTKLRFWATNVPNQPATTSGLVEYAPSLAKYFDCTIDDLRECLTQLGGVLM